MDPAQTRAYFVARSPRHQLAFGYVWNRPDFPWLGIWEENASRAGSPWNGAGLTRGMEFGVSPFPETRRQMIDRGRLFGVPTYRWIPARSQVSVEYWAVAMPASQVPSTLDGGPARRRSSPSSLEFIFVGIDLERLARSPDIMPVLVV